MRLVARCDNRRFLLLVFLFLAACVPAQGNADIDPTLDCATVLSQQPPPKQTNAIEIVVAAHSYREFCWQLYGPLLAANQVTDYAIHAVAQPYKIAGLPGQSIMGDLLRSGAAPDLMQFNEHEIATFAAAGLLAPLDECKEHYPEFADILEPLWQAATWQQQIWGIPYQVGMMYLYFNKAKLRQLGWSREAIAQLPTQIADGEFTLADLVQVAQTAIAAGVVAPGFGYWPNVDDPWTLQLTYAAYGGRFRGSDPNKLILTQQALTNAFAFHRDALHSGITHASFANLEHTFLDKTGWEDAVAHGRVLFWVASNYNWAMLTTEYRDDFAASTEPYLPPGYALYPPGQHGQPGVALASYTSLYVVPSAQATGRHHQAAACALLAKTLMPAINARTSARSGFMSVLRTQLTDAAFQAYPFSQDQMAIWRQSHPLPARHPGYSTYTAVLNELLTAVQSDALTPTEATEQAISRLRSVLGPNLIVE